MSLKTQLGSLNPQAPLKSDSRLRATANYLRFQGNFNTFFKQSQAFLKILLKIFKKAVKAK